MDETLKQAQAVTQLEAMKKQQQMAIESIKEQLNDQKERLLEHVGSIIEQVIEDKNNQDKTSKAIRELADKGVQTLLDGVQGSWETKFAPLLKAAGVGISPIEPTTTEQQKVAAVPMQPQAPTKKTTPPFAASSHFVSSLFAHPKKEIDKDKEEK